MSVYNIDGALIGVLAVIHNRPHQRSEQELAKLNRIARCISDKIRQFSEALTGAALRVEHFEFTAVISNKLGMLIAEIEVDLATDIKFSDAIAKTGDWPVITGNRMQLHILFQKLILNAIRFRNPWIATEDQYWLAWSP